MKILMRTNFELHGLDWLILWDRETMSFEDNNRVMIVQERYINEGLRNGYLVLIGEI